MIYITLDGRDNGAALSNCNTCCCHTLKMRPGETNLLVLDYTPWAVPIGGRGIVCAPSVELELDASACPPVTGTDPAPLNTSRKLQTDVNTTLAIDLTTDATPIGGAFTYKKVPLSGPYYGVLETNENGSFSYIPQNGFTGWDEFWYTMTDEKGRTVTRQILVWVSAAVMPAKSFAAAIEVNHAKIVVDTNLNKISIPITMTNLARSCEVYRMHIKARAQDCNLNCFDHLSCYDFSVGRC